jgi:hypothetical protein
MLEKKDADGSVATPILTGTASCCSSKWAEAHAIGTVRRGDRPRELLDDAALDPDQIVAIEVVRVHRFTLLQLHFALDARARIGAERALRLVGH